MSDFSDRSQWPGVPPAVWGEMDRLVARMAELEARLPLDGWEPDHPVYRRGSAKVWPSGLDGWYARWRVEASTKQKHFDTMHDAMRALEGGE